MNAQMAAGFTFVCSHCSHSIEAWDEGNPYYFDEVGAKHYAYHPDPQRDLCIGSDAPYLCLDCGHEFLVDSRQPEEKCPKCHSESSIAAFMLAGTKCPFCRQGIFDFDPENICIS